MLTDPYHSTAIVIASLSSPTDGRRIADAHGTTKRAGDGRGFTLIELIIVIAIIALLVAVALPSYRDHVRKSRRAEAQAYLMSIAGRQQQFLVDTRSYATSLSTINVPMPASVVASYDVALAVAAGPPPTFLLTAAPKSGTDQTQERCGTLTIDQTGAKTASLSSCW